VAAVLQNGSENFHLKKIYITLYSCQYIKRVIFLLVY
jgi:hypothetical protein